MNAVNEFVVYDNIEFSKGWVNRNRILVKDKDAFLTIPLKKDSDYLDIKDRYLADVWPLERKKLLNKVAESYRSSLYFKKVYPLIEQCLLVEETNLFRFLLHSLNTVKSYLNIATPFLISSSITIDHGLKAEDKVLALCKARQATEYINPIGGVQLYDKRHFREQDVELYFLAPNEIRYSQFSNDFIPSLSIIDVMMFNSGEQIQEYLNQYTIA